jgi:hypothetical protein
MDAPSLSDLDGPAVVFVREFEVDMQSNCLPTASVRNKCRPHTHRNMAQTSQGTVRDEEVYELTEDGCLHDTNPKRAGKYDDGSTIDWLREDAAERQRIHALRSHPGARGILLPLADASRLWFVVIMTGIGIGITGALLDILVKWCALNLPRDRLDLTSFLDGQAQ